MVACAVRGAGGLERRLGTADAVVVGPGAMVGAGVFAVLAPAAQEAGSLLLAGSSSRASSQPATACRRRSRPSAPQSTVVASTSWAGAEPVVRAGGAVAALGVLLSLLAGVSRTT